MTRRMSNTRRLRIFQKATGICHICGQKIHAGEAWEAEHIIPYEMTRDDSDDNLAPAHVSCHKAKTAKDKADIAKAKRREAKHKGAWRPKAVMPGSKGSKWKKTMDGRVIER